MVIRHISILYDASLSSVSRWRKLTFCSVSFIIQSMCVCMQLIISTVRLISTTHFNNTENLFFPLHGSCYMHVHVSEMYVEDDSSNLNVMHSISVNGSGCINTISWESYAHIHACPSPHGTVNVLILQRGASIQLLHEFQWDSLY